MNHTNSLGLVEVLNSDRTLLEHSYNACCIDDSCYDICSDTDQSSVKPEFVKIETLVDGGVKIQESIEANITENDQPVITSDENLNVANSDEFIMPKLEKPEEFIYPQEETFAELTSELVPRKTYIDLVNKYNKNFYHFQEVCEKLLSKVDEVIQDNTNFVFDNKVHMRSRHKFLNLIQSNVDKLTNAKQTLQYDENKLYNNMMSSPGYSNMSNTSMRAAMTWQLKFKVAECKLWKKSKECSEHLQKFIAVSKRSAKPRNCPKEKVNRISQKQDICKHIKEKKKLEKEVCRLGKRIQALNTRLKSDDEQQMKCSQTNQRLRHHIQILKQDLNKRYERNSHSQVMLQKKVQILKQRNERLIRKCREQQQDLYTYFKDIKSLQEDIKNSVTHNNEISMHVKEKAMLEEDINELRREVSALTARQKYDENLYLKSVKRNQSLLQEVQKLQHKLALEKLKMFCEESL